MCHTPTKSILTLCLLACKWHRNRGSSNWSMKTGWKVFRGAHQSLHYIVIIIAAPPPESLQKWGLMFMQRGLTL